MAPYYERAEWFLAEEEECTEETDLARESTLKKLINLKKEKDFLDGRLGES